MDILLELEKGASFHAAGNTSQANSIYSEILNIHPEHKETLNLKGILMRDSGNLHSATELFHKAIDKDPSRSDFHYNLAETFRIENEFKKAIESYNNSLNLNPDFYEAIYNRSLCFMESGQSHNAIKSFKESLEIKTEADAISNILTLLIAEKDYIQAKKLGNEYRFLNHPKIFSHLGMIEKITGNLRRAEGHLRKALELDNENIDSLNNLALIHKKNGLLQEAEELLDKACAVCPNEGFLHYNLAGIYNLSGKKEKALTHYQISLEHDPDNKSAVHMLNALKGDNTDSAPEQYVENLFDLYASTFEEDLVKKLKYNIPSELADLVKKNVPGRTYTNALDAGCGTGLCAVAFKDLYDNMIGVDLSPKMIQRASEKNLYTELITEEVTKALAGLDKSFDLILAADVFIYLGNLSNFFKTSSKLISEDGVLAFSIETCKSNYQLNPSGRYSHSHKYIEQLSKEHSFEITSTKKCHIRKDMGKWVKGSLFLLKKKI